MGINLTFYRQRADDTYPLPPTEDIQLSGTSIPQPEHQSTLPSSPPPPLPPPSLSLPILEPLDLTSCDGPDKAKQLDDLEILLRNRFQKSGEPIEEAIAAHRSAVKLISDEHTSKTMFLFHLGLLLCLRFKRCIERNDIEEAIAVMRRAVELLPDDHTPALPSFPIKSTVLHNLGASLLTRFERYKDIADLDDAIKADSHAVQLAPDSYA